MRAWRPPELCDIMVSELLGSFGDNELSPECLDGAQKCLKPQGVSIPSSYTSFVAPISAAKLWKGVSEMLEGRGVDTPFVVKLHSYFQSADPQPLFRFDHPNPLPERLVDNSRFGSVSFQSSVRTTVHGFAGYFECVLYKDTTLSILPATHTPGMFSWFPLFIPLRAPLQVEAGHNITFNMWRYLLLRALSVLLTIKLCTNTGVAMGTVCGTNGAPAVPPFLPSKTAMAKAISLDCDVV